MGFIEEMQMFCGKKAGFLFGCVVFLGGVGSNGGKL